MSNDSISDTKPFSEEPISWNWKLQDIIDYIQRKYNVALVAYINEPNGTGRQKEDFDNVVSNVLLYCLDSRRRTTYAYDHDSKDLRKAFAAFHRHPSIPFSDVYSSLGWFISYAEVPTASLKLNSIRHLCYNRLCFSIGKAFEFRLKKPTRHKLYPTMTHMFLGGSYVVHATTDEGIQLLGPDLLVSYSSSLPVDNSEFRVKTTNIKRNCAEMRRDLLRGRTPVLEQTMDHMEQNWKNNAGFCAETFTVASQHPGDDGFRVVGQGFALESEKMQGDFVSYDYHLQHGHRCPCPSCQHMFAHGGVSMQDPVTRVTYGSLPAGYVPSQDYPVQVPSPSIHPFYAQSPGAGPSHGPQSIPMAAATPLHWPADYPPYPNLYD